MVHGCTRSPPLLLFHHLVFIIVEITVKMTRAIYIAKWRVLPESCVKVSVGAFSWRNAEIWSHLALELSGPWCPSMLFGKPSLNKAWIWRSYLQPATFICPPCWWWYSNLHELRISLLGLMVKSFFFNLITVKPRAPGGFNPWGLHAV